MKHLQMVALISLIKIDLNKYLDQEQSPGGYFTKHFVLLLLLDCIQNNTQQENFIFHIKYNATLITLRIYNTTPTIKMNFLCKFFFLVPSL